MAVKDATSPRGDVSSETNSAHDEESPSSETAPSSLEQPEYHEYENVEQQQQHARLAVEARTKLQLSATAVPRSRERRNSFRQAVDQFGRPYEQIWFKEEEEAATNEGGGQEPTTASSSVSEASAVHHQSVGRNNNVNIDTRQLADGGRPLPPPVNLTTSAFTAAASSGGPRLTQAPTRQVSDGPVYANASRIDANSGSSKYSVYTPSAAEDRVRRPELTGGQARSQLSNIRFVSTVPTLEGFSRSQLLASYGVLCFNLCLLKFLVR
jgi:hypothetical protein